MRWGYLAFKSAWIELVGSHFCLHKALIRYLLTQVLLSACGVKPSLQLHMNPPSVLKHISEQPPLLTTHSLISARDEKRSAHHLGVSKKNLCATALTHKKTRPFLASMFPSLASSANPAVHVINTIIPTPTQSCTFSFTFKKTTAELNTCLKENSRFLLGL